ncbi:MAG: signal recognition particle-docking protein FtsY [Nitrospirae bacterium]|nr:signal recognition particle-docking protein FtsY [Nitrospirota bacterium]
MAILDIFKKGLEKTKGGFVTKVESLLLGKKQIDKGLLDELEEILISADVGVKTTTALIKRIEERLQRRELDDPARLIACLKDEIRDIFSKIDNGLNIESSKPFVMLVIGVNGAGKTTTIGKLAHRYKKEGKNVLLAAGDTFRAAAIEQLEAWGSRVGADVIRQKPGADPSAVAFDAVSAAKQRKTDVLIIDTAGRLHTKVNLMEELKKVKRTIGNVLIGAPHETLLVLDATNGQNAVSQARLFNEGIGVSGLIITKLDGTAKGGIVIGIVDEFKIPIRMVGIGEGMDDLIDFNASEFVDALFAKE